MTPGWVLLATLTHLPSVCWGPWPCCCLDAGSQVTTVSILPVCIRHMMPDLPEHAPRENRHMSCPPYRRLSGLLSDPLPPVGPHPEAHGRGALVGLRESEHGGDHRTYSGLWLAALPRTLLANSRAESCRRLCSRNLTFLPIFLKAINSAPRPLFYCRKENPQPPSCRSLEVSRGGGGEEGGT